MMDEMPPADGPTPLKPPRTRPRRRAGRLKRAMRRFAREQRYFARIAARYAPPPEGVPFDIDAFVRDRAMLVPVLHNGTRARHWRCCRERACRRARACLAPRRVCPPPGGGGDKPPSGL